MASEVSRLRSIDLENTVVRNPRVGLQNRPTSRTIESGATGPNASGDIYTGERDLNADYLIQGLVRGNLVIGSGSLEFQDDKITNVQGLNGLEPGDTIKHGDIVRMNGDTDFYGITGIEGDTIWLQESNTSFRGPNPNDFQIRKNKLDSVHFGYIKSEGDEDKFTYDKTRNQWAYTGIELEGPVLTNSEFDNYFPDDPLKLKFLPSTSDIAPDLTHVDTTAPDPRDAYGKKILSAKLARDTAEIALNPIPYPDDNINFKVYWGPSDNVQEKTENIDYAVNYTSDPDFTSAKPPYEDRRTAYIFFMNELRDVLQVRRIGFGFEGIFTLHEAFVSGNSDEARAVTNIFPNSKSLTVEGDPREFTGEIIKVGDSITKRFRDYNIEYGSGIVNFIEHSNMEPVVQAIIHQQNLIWDGVSVIRGVSRDKIKNSDGSDLVIPYGIGLTGIEGPVFFEDTDENNLVKDDDYIFEYTSGAFKVNTPLKPDECVLVSYFVEGTDVEKESLDFSNMRTRKYPVVESSVSIKKTFSDPETGKKGIRVLIEGSDFTMHYLTGRVVLLSTKITENLEQLEITYTPFAQINTIVQPVTDNTDLYRFTILDDVVETVDPFNLKFKVRNKNVSVPVEDPFGEEETIYEGTLLRGSLQSIKAQGEPGYGLENLTREQMYSLGITGLQKLGLDKKIGKTQEEFFDQGITGIVSLGLEPDRTANYITTGYTYNDDSKEISLNTAPNESKPKPDVNDLIVATYSYESDILPYAPVQVIYPILDEDDTSFLIEGFDRTDSIRPGMVIRIDNLTPKNIYYFRVRSVSYDGFNTTVGLYGSFPEDINNPTFLALDDNIQWLDLPSGLKLDTNVSVGSDTLVFSGFTLETLNILRSNALIMVDGEEIYEILTAEISGDELIVRIFPELQKSFPESLKISPPVYEVGNTDIQPFYPLVTDPPHPAFKIYYRQPNNAIYGYATVFIDAVNIVLVEYVDGQQQQYVFPFASYGSLSNLANSIKNTKSTLDPSKFDYYPFSLEDGEGEEQYFLGTGFWSSNLVIPFEEPDPIVIPDEGYLVTIVQEMFKHILIRCNRGLPNFLIEQRDRRDLFHVGNILAFRDKATGDLTFFDVASVSVEQEDVDYQENPLVHTRISLHDKFRDNMIAPVIYKYDEIAWNDVTAAITNIDYKESKITLNLDSVYFRTSSLVRFAERFVYQIRGVDKSGGAVTLTLDPSILEDVRSDQVIEVSSVPVYLDERPPQLYFPIEYSLPEGRSGNAYVESNDERIKFIEQLDGSSERSFEIEFERYNGGLAQFANAIELSNLAIEGTLTVNIEPWESDFDSQGSALRLVPTSKKELPYTYEVSEPAFRVNYEPTASGTVSEILLDPNSKLIQLKEWRVDDRAGSEKSLNVSYSNRTLDAVVAEINTKESLITPGTNPWGVDQQAYDSYYGSQRPSYYDIISFADVDSLENKEFPYTVNVTQNFERWTQLGVLNRNVLVEGTDYTIEGTGVALERGMEPYERYELSYLGLDNLAASEGEAISATCRYFYAIPRGYRVDVYMDFLNQDQFYLQKCTERRFIEIVTVPQIEQILQQAGNSVGIGADNGSDNEPRVWDGGLVDLYYQLQDEKIKKEIYLKIFHWYKHRLRNFAVEAELILGFKFGHCNFLGTKSNGQFSLETQYVEDENYTLTKDEDLNQIENGFSQFYPVGYKGDAPRQYPRFGNQYKLSNEVFCYNIAYLNNSGTAVEKREGRIVAQGAMLSTEIDASTGFSKVDFDILPYTSSTSPITGTIDREYVFDFDEVAYNSISKLREGVSQLRTASTNITASNQQVFSVEAIPEYEDRDSDDLRVNEGDFPVNLQMYVEDDFGGFKFVTVMELKVAVGDAIENLSYAVRNSRLIITFTEKVNLYIVSYNKEEKMFRADHDNFKFLKRIDIGDEVKLSGKKQFYKINEIDTIIPGVQRQTEEIKYENGDSILYDDGVTPVRGIYTNKNGEDLPEGESPVYEDLGGKGVPYYKTVSPDQGFERMTLEEGKYFTEKEVTTLTFRRTSVGGGSTDWYLFQGSSLVTDSSGNGYNIERIERGLPKSGLNVIIRRNESSDFPVPFVAWDDEFSLGSMARGSKIAGHETSTNKIKKTFSFAEILNLLRDHDEWFTVQEGTYDEFTGQFKPRHDIKINLKYLNLREERKVSDVLDAIKYNLSGFRLPIVFPFPPFTVPPFFVKISNTFEAKDQRGAERYFYVNFERYYDPDSDSTGFEEGIVFRSRDRNTWFRLGFMGGAEDVTNEYGFDLGDLHTNFYYPNNLYLKLLLEKQFWLTEAAIIRDLIDTNNKIKRAFKVQRGPDNITVNSGSSTLPFSEFRSYLNQVSGSLKSRLEAYAEHLRFLLDSSDTDHEYLVENTSGPLYRTLMETDASSAIERSAKQAAQAQANYSVFNGERLYHLAVNNYNAYVWDRDYCRWSLSLEEGLLFQEQARQMVLQDTFLDFGISTYPGIALELIDYGDNSPFVVNEPGFRVTYSILPSSNYVRDEYDDAMLQIRYTVAGEEDDSAHCIYGTASEVSSQITQRCFLLSNYGTLDDLASAINEECKTPESGLPVIKATVAFDYPPYGEYSTRWLLKNYRAVSNNESNGPDVIDDRWKLLSRPGGGQDYWTPLDDANISTILEVSNVDDHELYDSRVFFLNRRYKDTLRLQNIEGTESLPTGFKNNSNETIMVWPHYVPTKGKEILDEVNLGLLPLSGRWATDFVEEGGTQNQDYTSQFNVLEIQPVTGVLIRDYAFLDYARAEEQLPGSESPRNTLYEIPADDVIAAFNYDYETGVVFSGKGEDKLTEIVERSRDISQQKPESEVIRRVQIRIRFIPPYDATVSYRVFIEFDLKENPTVLDLVNAINRGNYAGFKAFDDTGKRIPAQDEATLAKAEFFKATLIGEENLQGQINTTDLVTRYIPQEIHVATHRYYPTVTYNSILGLKRIVEKPLDVPIGQTYQVGWVLREEDYQPGSVITLRVDPRAYSPNSHYRFIPDVPNLARENTLRRENKDILAFDLYSWDDGAAYKIKDNVLYIRSASIPEDSVAISLLDETFLDQNSTHPEKRFKLIKLIQKINRDGVAKKKFFANLRFGRRSALDYEYTYLPDTAIWFGGDGWVPIEKAERDIIYLDIDTVFLLNSEGGNALYRIDPVLTPFPVTPDTDTVYRSKTLHLEADVNAFNLVPNNLDYDFTDKEYTVDQTAEELTIDIEYETTVDGSSAFSQGSYTIDTLATAIDSALDSGNSIFVASKVSGFPSGISATNLVQASNNSLPGTLLADYNVDSSFVQAFDLTSGAYDTIGELINEINNLSVSVPSGSNQPFLATNAGISSVTSSISLDSGSGGLPATLTASSANAINLAANTGSDFQIISPTWSISGNTLTLSCTVRELYIDQPAINISMDTDYSGRDYTVSGGTLTLNWTHHIGNTFSHTVDLTVATTLQAIVNDINSWQPNGSDVAFSASVVWLYPYDPSSSLLEVTSTSIPDTGVGVNTRGVYEASLYSGGTPRSISDLVTEINGISDKTGFTVSTTIEEYEGYKSFRADYLRPITTLTGLTANTEIEIDLRLTPALYVLNMSYTAIERNGSLQGDEPGTLTLDSDTLRIEKPVKQIDYPAFSANTYTYTGLANKNISSLVESAMDLNGTLEDPRGLSYSRGTLKVDVALILAEGVTYGRLRNRQKSPSPGVTSSPTVDTIDLFVNDPEEMNTHVYFGFLGDIRFWQISDYNLYRQYALIKRRLGLPWSEEMRDGYVSDTSYSFGDFFHNLHENDKFLSYLKYTRFGQLSDSIRFERLVENKYLWLFLKLHKELGCDQRVQYLIKKIEEDEQKAKNLRQ